MAYLAAVAAHPAYAVRFAPDLVQPGLRVPLTADPALFAEAAALGREVVWLHTFGERFADASAGRPPGPPRAEGAARPALLDDIPADADALAYLAPDRRLMVGTAAIENVAPEVWAYEVSGKQVLTQWFSYRRLDRSRPTIGDKRPPSPLETTRPAGWLPEYTTELLNVLNVLTRLVALEPAQADLLDRIVAGPLLAADDLDAAGAFADAPAPARRTSTDAAQIDLGLS